MSFLRGKSTSYTRFALPKGATVAKIDEAVKFRAFKDVEPGKVQATGFCSWRNLLDAPVDAGFLEATPLWLTGLRKDTKKAPPALIQAETARRLADLRSTFPTGVPKFEEKAVKAEVKDKLNQKAQPRPAHAAVLVNTETSLLYVDGIASAHVDLAAWLELTPGIYQDSKLNAQYLAWCAWRAGNGVDCPCSPTGDIAFREPRDAGASYDNAMSINELLDSWLGEQHATVASVRLIWAVDTHNVELTLQAAGLKVAAMDFPEEIHKALGSLDDRMALRMSFLMEFEAALAKDFMEFAQLHLEGKLPEEFVTLTQAEVPA